MRSSLAGALVLAGAAVACLAGVLQPGYPENFHLFAYWSRLLAVDGIAAAYDGPWPPYPNYPPAALYPFALVGHAYRWFVDSGFALDQALASQPLVSALKGVFVSFHLATGAAIFTLVRRVGRVAAVVSSAAYALNPAAIYAVAFWGTTDSIHSFFVVVALGLLLVANRSGWSGAAFGLALMSKPQALLVAPILAVVLYRRGRQAAARFVVACFAAAFAVSLPFFVGGRLRELAALPERFSATMPVISAEAHNLWWLMTHRLSVDPYSPAATSLIGPLSFSTASLILVALVLGVATRRALRTSDANELFALSAYLAFAWFMVSTQAHANWGFMVLPLLALALGWSRQVLPVLLAATALTFANLFLTDPLRESWLHGLAGGEVLWWAGQSNALAGTIVLAWWSVRVLLTPGGALSAPRPAAT